MTQVTNHFTPFDFKILSTLGPGSLAVWDEVGTILLKI